MNLQYLNYIICIERCGSISAAAAKLFVSQPYLSRIVHTVEKQYQITLFTRGKHGINVTDSGRVFIDMARNLLDNMEQFDKIFSTQMDSQMHLRIASAPSSHVMDAYIRMIKDHPEAHLRFHYKEEHNYDVINDVYTNAADVGVILISSADRDMVESFFQIKRISFRQICCLDFQLIVGQHHPLLKKESPITLEDIYQYNFVVYAPQSTVGIRSIENMYNQAALNTLLDLDRVHQIHYVYSRASLHNMITTADCIALGAKETREQTDQFHFVSIPFPSRQNAVPVETVNYIWFIYSRDRELNRPAKSFLSYLINYYGDETGSSSNSDAVINHTKPRAE